MDAGHPLSLLIYMTFAAVIAVVVILSLRYFRKSERHPMEGERERTIDEIREDGPTS